MSEVRNFNIGVIGCGRIGRMHIDAILNNCPHIKILYVVDHQPDRDWLQSREIPSIGDDPNLIFEDAAIDAVLIATSSTAHVELIERAARAGKDIFCEKPVSFDLNKIAMALHAVKKAGVRLQVGFNRRFDANFMRVRQSIQKGEIGDPHIIKITNRDPKRPDLNFIPRSGGLFLDFNVHDFDMARFLTNDEVEDVYAMGACLVDPKIAELGDIDTAIITLTMKSGAYCIIDSTREAVYGYDQRIEVFGNLAQIEAQNTTETNTVLSSKDFVRSEKPHYSFVERYQEAFLTQIKIFASNTQNDDYCPADGSDTYMAVAIALAAQKSLQENRVVKLTEILEEKSSTQAA